MFSRAAAFLLVWMAACDVPREGNPESVCQVAQRPVPLPPELREASGIVQSGSHPQLFWTHTDAANPPVLYAMDATGRLHGRLHVVGAENRDWEDIARGPCSDGICLYIADIGDNDEERERITVYQIPEPVPGDTLTSSAERFDFRYPGGPRDAEALFVLPAGELFIITKGISHPVALYRAPSPLRPGETVELEHLRDLSAGPLPRLDRVTGADASPDGRWVAVRTLRSLLLYRTPDLLTGEELSPLHVDLAPLGEHQGEGVGMGGNDVVVLASEGSRRTPATLALLQCIPGEEPPT